jgi:hypothetical protein
MRKKTNKLELKAGGFFCLVYFLLFSRITPIQVEMPYIPGGQKMNVELAQVGTGKKKKYFISVHPDLIEEAKVTIY